MKIPHETFAGLTLIDLYGLTKELETVIGGRNLSQEACDFLLEIQTLCEEALCSRPPQTSQEALLKVARLGAERIKNSAVYDRDAVSRADKFIESIVSKGKRQ